MTEKYLATLNANRRAPALPFPFSVALMVLVASLLGLSAAQVAAHIEPSAVAIDVAQGGTATRKITIQNPSDSVLNLQVLYRDWSLGMTGDVKLRNGDNGGSGISAWLDYVTDPITLAPGEARTLDYTVAVPQDAAPGTHWGGIFFLSEPADPAPGLATATIGIQVGHILYVHVPPLEADGRISGIFEEPPESQDGMYTFLVQYENTGNSLQFVEGLLHIIDAEAQPVTEVVIKKSVVLPGVPRAFVLGVYGPLPAGNYTALAVLDYGDPDRELAGSLDFTLTERLGAPPEREEVDGEAPPGE